MAFPKSCSLALDIRVLRDTGMVGQSRARLPLQRPQRAYTSTCSGTTTTKDVLVEANISAMHHCRHRVSYGSRITNGG